MRTFDQARAEPESGPDLGRQCWRSGIFAKWLLEKPAPVPRPCTAIVIQGGVFFSPSAVPVPLYLVQASGRRREATLGGPVSGQFFRTQIFGLAGVGSYQYSSSMAVLHCKRQTGPEGPRYAIQRYPERAGRLLAYHVKPGSWPGGRAGQRGGLHTWGGGAVPAVRRTGQSCWNVFRV